jgi:hypothetical protein
MDRRQFLSVAAGSLISIIIGVTIGCAPKPTRFYFNPYVAKNTDAPEIVHCFTTIGHKRGTKPFIFGGTCVCTPTNELMEQYHEDGFLLDYDLNKLIDEYKRRGIVLSHEHGWQCNNQCKKGPHLVFGGKCMVPPVLGTHNFENVITGTKPVVK